MFFVSFDVHVQARKRRRLYTQPRAPASPTPSRRHAAPATSPTVRATRAERATRRPTAGSGEAAATTSATDCGSPRASSTRRTAIGSDDTAPGTCARSWTYTTTKSEERFSTSRLLLRMDDTVKYSVPIPLSELFLPLAIRTTDYSYHRLFVPWSVRTIDRSYHLYTLLPLSTVFVHMWFKCCYCSWVRGTNNQWYEKSSNPHTDPILTILFTCSLHSHYQRSQPQPVSTISSPSASPPGCLYSVIIFVVLPIPVHFFIFIFIRQKRQHSMKSENEQQLRKKEMKK